MPQFNSSKVGPRLQRELSNATDETGEISDSYRVGVRVDFTGDVSSVENAGLEVEAVVGGIAAGTIDLRDLEGLVGLDNVKRVSLERDYQLHLNDSVPHINANKVHTMTPTSYKGEGVIVGVIDTGIDIYHGAFRKSNDDTRILGIRDYALKEIQIAGSPTGGNFTLSFRPPSQTQSAQTNPIAYDASANDVENALTSLSSIGANNINIGANDIVTKGGPLPGTPVVVKFTGQFAGEIADETANVLQSSRNNLSGGSSPSVSVQRYHEFTESDINTALNNPSQTFLHEDVEGHGTHVAGIAAGNGSQAGDCRGAGTYVGAAPKADFVIVKGIGKTLGGIDYIFSQAHSTSKPAVINISYGGNLGPHNGMDEDEIAIDAELAASLPSGGRTIVTSAGNTANVGTHTQKTISAGGGIALDFRVPPHIDDDEWLHVWYEGSARLQAQVHDPNPTGGRVPAGSGNQTRNTSGFQQIRTNGENVRIGTRLNESNPASGVNKHLIFIQIRPPVNNQITSGWWTLQLQEMSGNSSHIDVWINDKGGRDTQSRFRKRDQVNQTSLNEPGTANRVITVGAYKDETEDIYSRSSRGPTADERPKPEVTAPGVGIQSSKSDKSRQPLCSECCIDFYDVKSGTSMAAPHVTGVAALMFEKDSTLSYDDIRKVIKCTARPPQGVSESSLPDNKWGEGMINALEAVDKAVDGCPEDDGSNGGSSNGGGAGGGGGGPPSYPPLLQFTEEPMSSGPSLLADLHAVHKKLHSTPLGHSVADIMSTHFSEVHRLIRTNRKVATLWHRCGGPALVRGLLAWAREGDDRAKTVAFEKVDKESFQQLLDRLARQGSEALKADIERHRSLMSTLTQALA